MCKMCRGSPSWKAFLPEGLNENGPFCLSVLVQTWYHAWAKNSAFQQACIFKMTLDTSSLEHSCFCISPWQSVSDVSYSNIHNCANCSVQEGEILCCSLPLLAWFGNKESFRVMFIPSCYGSNMSRERWNCDPVFNKASCIIQVAN